MGSSSSSLSIVNNTPNEWICKLGQEEKLDMAGIIVRSITAASIVLASPLTASMMATGSFAVSGASSSALTSVSAATASAAGVTALSDPVSSFSIAIGKGVNDQLSKDFVKIAAGQKRTWGDLKPKSNFQGTCVRTYIVDKYTVRTETVYMRPIDTGKAKSTRDHDIQWWINRNGVETHDIVVDKKDKDQDQKQQDQKQRQDQKQQKRMLKGAADSTETGSAVIYGENGEVMNENSLMDLKEGDQVFIYPTAA